MNKDKKPWIAFIAANNYTPAFDSTRGKTEITAIAAIKRKNSPDWKDCTIFTKYDSEKYSEID
jgi:hypothetical protein